MLLTATSESVAFFFGALTTMPAVREFSLYAGMAVFIDFLLQISCFVSLLSLDARRQRAHRLDCCCCAQSTEATDDMILLEPRETTHNGWLFQVAEILSKPLLSCSARPIIMVIFTALFAASIPAASKLEIGLDQKLSMPKDSYVLEWFKDENRYLSVGAPVYFVVKEGYNYTDPAAQNRICGGSGCSEDSLLGRIYQASNQPNYTYIAHPASSWIDDYFDWLRPIGNPPCCRQYTNGSFCPAQVNGTCHACNVTFVKRRPSPKDFPEFLSFFLEDNPGRKCSKGGHAAYQVAVERRGRRSVESIGATYFMSYHTVLKTSADFINALRYARELSDNITKSINDRQKHDRSLMYDEATNRGRHEQNTSVINTGIKVFPYSVFYVFYEQYLTIVADAAVQLSICLAAMFVVTFLLLGLDIHSSLIILVCVVMIMSDMLGVMYIWDINLNAVSLVNLVMCIGISVEFCSHMVRAFAVSTCGSKIERARHAFVHTGSSVFSGITLTKSGGIIVLAFSKSQLFQVFYFRMYLSIVLLGAFHGLIFLPILLSYAGPGINKAKLERQQKLTESSRTHEDNSPKF